MHFFVISFKNAFTYRSGVLFRIISSIFWVLVMIALWTYVFRHDEHMTKYMISYAILANIIGMFYSGQMADEIGGKVSNGMFAIDLIRPMNIIGMAYQRSLGVLASSFLLTGIPVILVFMPMLLSSLSIATPIYILYVFIAIILGHILNVLIYSLIGFTTFVFIESHWINRIAGDTLRFFSGAFVPLAFFPDWLGRIADFLPSKYLYSFPLMLILNNEGAEYVVKNFAIMISWIILLAIVLLLSYKGAVNKCTVQGG